MKQKIKKILRKYFWLLLFLAIIFIVFIGPWPANWNNFQHQKYARDTFARVYQQKTVKSAVLKVGIAKVDITPSLGEPMAGYSRRNPMSSEKIADKIWVKALTLSNAHKTVTLVSADILLVTPELRMAILAKTKLAAADIYFSATHNHSGPGGYSRQFIYQLVLGKYNEKIFIRLLNAFVTAIQKSRHNLQKSNIKVIKHNSSKVEAQKFIKNRLNKGGEVYGSLFLLMAYSYPQNTLLASLVVASAHATCLGRKNRAISCDYPGELQRLIAQKYQCFSMCMAGAVGSMKPASFKERGFAKAKYIAKNIGTIIGPYMNKKVEAKSHKKMLLDSRLLEVNLPPQYYLLGKYFRISPFALQFLHNRKTYVHILQINKSIWLGMPCDYSGELAITLETKLNSNAVITSFNGDYIGYLVSYQSYQKPHYETRVMNFFGPWCGEYFNNLSEKIVATRLKK